MVTNRTAMTGYFEETEELAIQRYADRNRMTTSKALEALVKKAFAEDGKTPEELAINNDYENRLSTIEDRLEKFCRTVGCTVEKYEFYLEQMSRLQEDVDRLTRDSWRKPVEYFTDDQVASYVGARAETVKEWRLGLRKPRGSNICSLLEEFQLDYGRWRKRG